MPVRVELGKRSYEVHTDPGCLARLGIIARAAAPLARRAFVVIDAGAAAHAPAPLSSLKEAAFTVEPWTIAGGESSKCMPVLEGLLTTLTRARIERSDLIVAIGGGAVCDLAGFAAATYRRGVAIINCPTTLLSMVDASVGGKTGINLTVDGVLKKNMAGAFWQPAAVIADARTLSTLRDREFRAGLGECLKHGLIASDAALWEHTLSVLPRILARDADALADLIPRNIALKAAIVGDDEREQAPHGRVLLNLGHTFAHVIESHPHAHAPGFPAPLLHGEAVALGLIAAAATAHNVGSADTDFPAAIRAAVQAAGLPTRIHGLPSFKHLAQLMADDKKSAEGSLRLVLPRAVGVAPIVTPAPDTALHAGWSAITEPAD